MDALPCLLFRLVVDQKPESWPGGARAATGIPQQPKNITTPLPYIGEDNVFYMIPPRDNTSYPGAFTEYYYDLPINHLPGIHWCVFYACVWVPHRAMHQLMYVTGAPIC